MKKMKSLTVSLILVTSSAFGGAGFMDLGYANVSGDNIDTQGAVSFNVGAKFGKRFNNRIGVEYIYIRNSGNKFFSASRLGDIYYFLGYEAINNLSIGANIGFGFEDINIAKNNTIRTNIRTKGLVCGVTAVYKLGDVLELVSEYKRYNLNSNVLNYSKNTITVSIGVCY